MAKLLATRVAQYLLHSEFTFLVTDTFTMTDGVTKAFSVAAPVADVINLPDVAVLVGGDVTVEVASNDSSTATIAVGDSGNATRYLGATSIKAAARTALVPTGYRGAGENLRITLANAGANATAGKVTVRAAFAIQDKMNETYPL